MVRDEVHTDSLGTNRAVCLGEVGPQVFYRSLSLRDIVHHVMQTPAVVHVEGRLGQLVRFVLIFGQCEHIRMRQAQLAHRVIPEIGRHFAGYVAAETVDSDRVHPPMHRFLHLCAHRLAAVVQLGDIRPVVLNHQVTQAVAIVPALVLGPLAVRCRVVRYPVEDDFKAHLMRLFEKMLEVGTRTELGVDRAVVDDGVVTA